MRPIMTESEAKELIQNINEIEEFNVRDEKKREEELRVAIKTCDDTELIKVIKHIYSRMHLRIAAGKKATSCDERFFHLAKDKLYSELTNSMNLSKDKVKEDIVQNVEASVAQEIECALSQG